MDIGFLSGKEDAPPTSEPLRVENGFQTTALHNPWRSEALWFVPQYNRSFARVQRPEKRFSLPIAYDINTHKWVTKMEVSEKYKEVSSVKLIYYLPALLDLSESEKYESELEEYILVANMSVPKYDLFQTKQMKSYYTLCYTVIEALADSWNVDDVRELVKQADFLFKLRPQDKGVPIGKKIYRDSTGQVKKSNLWTANGYTIKNPKSTL